jgi:hypothetical protein
MGMIPKTDAPAAFKKPDIAQFIPPEMKDAVDRIVAAGVKVIFNPATREQVMEQVNSREPVAKKMATSVVGLLLTLDKKSKGGLPMAAIFPAALELLGESAEVLVAAKQPVTQADFNEAAQMALVLLAKKLGASDEQIMQGLQQHVPAEEGAA